LCIRRRERELVRVEEERKANNGNAGNSNVPGDSNSGEEPGQEKGMSGGVIALIVILAIAVLGGGGFAVYWFVIKPKKTPETEE